MTFEIIVPGRFIEAKDAVQMQSAMEGIITLSAVKGGHVIRERSFKNLILDNGLNRFGTEQAQGTYYTMHVGLGTTPPEHTDTALGSHLASLGTGSGSSSAGTEPDWYNSLTISWLSSVGQLGNNNLTEIGIGGIATNLFSRALILDSNGQPTTFPISDDEQLSASYELRMYPPLSDWVGQVDVSGPRDVVARAMAVNSSSGSRWSLSVGNSVNGNMSYEGLRTGDLVSITDGTPSGNIASSSGGSSMYEYVPMSFKRGGRCSWPSTQVSNANIRTHLVIPSYGAFQVQYDPPLAKTNEQTMYLEYEHSWARR